MGNVKFGSDFLLAIEKSLEAAKCPDSTYLKSIPFKLAVFFCYDVEIILKGISQIILTWFPHGSKKTANLSGINLNKGLDRIAPFLS